MQQRFSRCLIAIAIVLAVTPMALVSTTTVVEAAGTPDISVSKDMPGEVLLGSAIPVTLNIENASGTDGYNMLIRDVLPVGVSYVAGSATPDPQIIPQGNSTTVLVWNNVADSLDGTTVSFDYSVQTDSSYDVDDTVTNDASAYVNSDPRVLPNVNPATGAAIASTYTGNDDASATTTLIPFEITKTEPNAESELLRGVHDHQTVYTLTVDNNLVNPTTGFSVVDYVPAQLEFLGCGTADNTTTGEEYPGSGPIPNYGAALANGTCVVPFDVTTVTTDPDGPGPMPNGVYTRVEWNAAAIAAARGSADLAPSGSFSIDYVAAIPLRRNVDPGPTLATSNLDNNTGSLTTESEADAFNFAEATGAYNGATTYTDSDIDAVVAEDVSIHKTASAATFVQGDAIDYTLFVESSEYTTSTSTITVTDTIPATVDFTGATPTISSGPILNPNGTETYTWILPAFTTPSSDATIVVNTQVREFYRTGSGGDGSPIASNDSFTNTTDLSTDATIITANDGSTSVVPVVDESSVTETAGGPTILKEVSEPAASLTCGDGTGVAFDPTFASSYRPGDRVCFRLNVFFPLDLDTLNPLVTDFLPAGFTFDSWALGADNSVPAVDIAFTDADPVLTWDLSDVDAFGDQFQVVVQAVIEDPNAAAHGDILDNLMKFRYSNLSGGVFQLRDQALAEWSEPDVSLNKGVMTVNGTAVPGAPADGVTIQEGDVVRYQVTVRNDGTEDALDVSLRDVLPTGIDCGDVVALSITGGGACDATNGWIQWDAADDIDLAQGGGSRSFTYDVTVPSGISAGASLVNTAGVRTFTAPTNTGTPFEYRPGSNIDPTLTGNTDPARDTSEIITALPTLTKVRSTALTEPGNNDGQVTVGETISYTVTLGLGAGLTYVDAVITDDLDAEKDLVAGSVTATIDGAPLPVGGVSLVVDDAGNSWRVDFPTNYFVPPGAAQQVVVNFDAVLTDVATNVRDTGSPNEANFDYSDADGDTRNLNDEIGVGVVEPNIVLDKRNDDADAIVTSGQEIAYTLDVENQNVDDDSNAIARVSTAHDTVVIDTIPAEMVVLDGPGGTPVPDGLAVGPIGPDGGVWNSDDRTITWTIATMAPGASVALDYSVRVVDPAVAGARLQNTAVARTTSMPGTVAGERTFTSVNGGPGSGYQDPADNTVNVPGFALLKNGTPDSATVGETITYTVDVTLPAGLIAYDVTVVDQLPAGVTYESLTSVTCDQGGTTCAPDVTAATVVPAGPASSGDDVAFFLDDLTPAATGDRIVTITYVGYVADVAAADDGATLMNAATLYWNNSNAITVPPTTIPPAGGFTGTTGPSSDVVGTVEPSLSIDKDVAGQNADDDARRAVPGETLTYTVTVTNSGTAAAYDVTVSDVATDDAWAFTDTTLDPGVTNTDADPVGGLAWNIAGPIAPNGGTATITYELVVPAGYDSADENPTGPEQTNVADVPSYFAVPEATRTANPGRVFRDYDNVVSDSVAVELDLASIGDLVWFDVNGNGTREPGEPGIADTTVTVTYLGIDGMVGGGDDEVFVTATLGDGTYVVSNLPGGEYTVDVDELDADFVAGLTPSYDLDGTTLAPNGFWAGSLGEDDDERDVDFGYTGTGSIGDTIWLDQNLDGAQNPGEDGLGGIDVTVTWLGLDGVVGGGDDLDYDTTTDANGIYRVDGLPAGEFTVVIDETSLPTGYQNVADPENDNNNRSAVTLGDGSVPGDNIDLDQDFGYAGSGSIGDTIYLDSNNSGSRDLGESGLEGVVVDLVHFGADGVAGGTDDSFFSTTTVAGGTYLFENLPYGNYEVTVTGGITLVTNTDDPDLPGSPDAGDSVSTTTLTVAAPDDLDQDFGYNPTSVLGDRVWLDLNDDGAQDPGEPGLAGIVIDWTGPFGLSGSVTTDDNGDYIISNIPDGDYTLTVDPTSLPAGLDQTFDDDGLGTANTSTTSLVTSDLDQDFGYSGNGTIGDTVWLDLDADGSLNGEEVGFENVLVTLEWAQPSGPPIVLTTTTDANGNYSFANLPAGDFTVTVDTGTLPTGVVETYDADGGEDSTSAVELDPGESDLGQDFGYNSAGSIGDTIWFDRDGDGELAGDETGLPGIGVTLVWAGPTGPETFTTTTGPDGTYLFENLPPGDYTVTVDIADLPTGMTPTFDADGANDSTSSLTLGLGEANTAQDFGYNGDGSIGDTVYLDLDGDGVQSLSEPGVPGQTVELVWASPAGPVTYTTTTDDNGNYQFGGLPPADYTVTVVGGVVAAASNTGDPGGIDGDSTNSITLGDGEINVDQDFGYQGSNGIGDTIWLDADADGVDDGAATEPRLGGVDVSVVWFGPDGAAGGGDDVVLPTTSTFPNGVYIIGNLPDGSYSVTVVDGVPDGADVNTFDADGGTNGPDGTSIVTDLGVGTTDPELDLDQDFGYAGSGSIGDTIWLDLDGDGIDDVGEPGIPAAVVTLTWAGPDGVFATPDDFVFPTQTTGTDGNYLFENLPDGEFRVDVANLPTGVTPTADPDGGDDNSSSVSLESGANDLDQDFGYRGDASVGDTIWLDVDGDGTQDANEPGIPGVSVTVTSPGVDGTPRTADDMVVVVVTDDDGTYVVAGLPPGTTTVSYDPTDLPASYVPDSDLDDGDVTTATVDLDNGDDVRDVDFGVVGDASVEGTVWVDTDGDGVRDPGEAGIPGVTVDVTWAGPNGPIVITVVTDANGDWNIDDVPAGDYTTEVDVDTVPDGYVPTTPIDGATTVPAGGSGRVDNGFVPGGSIGDRVWEDTDNDGVQDPGERGVPGVTITLTRPDGTVVGTTTTGPDGSYVFGDLPPGDYVVTVVRTTVPTGFVVVFDIDGSPDGVVVVTLGPGADRTDIDFGIDIPELPRTGLYVGMTLLTALGFLAAGLALLAARRRRQAVQVS